MLMSRYSDEREATVLAKLLPPHNMTVAELAARKCIFQPTLYNLRNEAKFKGEPVPQSSPHLTVKQHFFLGTAIDFIDILGT